MLPKNDVFLSALSNVVPYLRSKSLKSTIKLSNIDIIKLKQTNTIEYKKTKIINKGMIKFEKAKITNKKINKHKIL